jgi:transcription elongation factor Elf1
MQYSTDCIYKNLSTSHAQKHLNPSSLSNPMYIPKRYGESKKQNCPFCGKPSVTENAQGVPVCTKHKNDFLDLKCICGEWLDVKKGKWGPYFTCLRCGNISFRKAMEANPDIKPQANEKTRKATLDTGPTTKPKKKEIIITSDEVDVYY